MTATHCPRCRVAKTPANTYTIRNVRLDVYCADCRRALNRDQGRVAYQRDPERVRQRVRIGRKRRALRKALGL